MQAPNTPKPNQPQQVFCNNPKWYELYATTEERLAYYARLEQEKQDRRYRELLKDLDLLEDENQ